VDALPNLSGRMPEGHAIDLRGAMQLNPRPTVLLKAKGEADVLEPGGET
jgi:hypothetical protein